MRRFVRELVFLCIELMDIYVNLLCGFYFNEYIIKKVRKCVIGFGFFLVIV